MLSKINNLFRKAPSDKKEKDREYEEQKRKDQVKEDVFVKKYVLPLFKESLDKKDLGSLMGLCHKFGFKLFYESRVRGIAYDSYIGLDFGIPKVLYEWIELPETHREIIKLFEDLMNLEKNDRKIL